MKKLIIILLAVLMLGCVTACGDYLDGEYRSSSLHVKKEDSSRTDTLPDAEVYLENADADSLSDAVIQFIRARDEYGIIRVANYDGDINAEAETVCIDAAYNSAYGAYAVEFVSFAVNKYVPFSEVKVYLSYKEGIKDDKSISIVRNENEARSWLEGALRAYDSELIIYTSSDDVDAAYMLDCIEGIYFGGSSWLPVMPDVTATSYPEEGEERIIELKFSYPYSAYRMNTMRDRTEEELDGLIERFEHMGELEAVHTLCTILGEECEYVGYGTTSDEYDRRSDKYTAYGALALGRASGEGYAMAVQLVCNELNIECMVVRGRHNNVAHAWNIVRIDGSYYHVDAALMAQEGSYNTFMINDARFAQSYFWDLDMYPACNVDRHEGEEYENSDRTDDGGDGDSGEQAGDADQEGANTQPPPTPESDGDEAETGEGGAT